MLLPVLVLALFLVYPDAAARGRQPEETPLVMPGLNETTAPRAVVEEEVTAEQPAVEKVKEPAKAVRIHKVWLWQESRDCLWNIAKKYYNDPWQWKKIYLANKSQIKDPRIIYPKQELIIPPGDEAEKKQ